MNRFASLLERLVLTPSRNGKLTLLRDYLAATPDPDRGYAIAAIAGDLSIPNIKPALLREIIGERMDPVLFAYSYDYVGDLAETIALAWDRREGGRPRENDLRLAAVVERLRRTGRTDRAEVVTGYLDALDASSRFALLKLVTGGMRIGVSARLIKQALSDHGGKDIAEIEELWHGIEPPYAALFAWLDGTAAKPQPATDLVFRPVMLSTPVGEGDLDKLDPKDFAAEWKWDGIRIQAVCSGGAARLYSRSGDDITASFPDVVAAFDFDGVIDGELLVGTTARTGGRARTFSDLQQRLNRKTVSMKMQRDYPAMIRAYDLLIDRGEDVRDLPFAARRARLEACVEKLPSERFDLSPLVAFEDWEELERLRAEPPDPVIEGVMIKRLDSPYVAGRAKGNWFKWKRDPFTVDAVLMYAQRGHGKRSSYYSDFTFGVLDDADEEFRLLPVGKAYFGFSDEELRELDRFVRNNTVERFGPVRSVRAEPDFGFVLEVAFEGLNRSKRHKSGVAMRFPRIARLRRDKLPCEADGISALTAMLDDGKTH
ncbi:MAG: cisplatin damage response ATP-dependent DNA ligase [Brucellaceae bacterium]|nr:cisplatin damage response ATP-dependent DNA ligase [Brucellaceae bacterium]